MKGAFCVGLTGGIGCGKSTVAALFAQLGAGIVDTDLISHRLTQSGGVALAAIRGAFGDGYIDPDGALDRDKMRRLIFSDVAAKKTLESILHPLIMAQTKLQLGQLHNKPYIIIVVPLLPESPSFRRMVQRVLVVDCDVKTQIERVAGRTGLNEAEIRAIVAQQTSRAGRLGIADDVIHNNADIDSLADQVHVLHVHYSTM